MVQTGFSAMGFTPVPLSQRTPRRPTHTFQVEHRPWQIQPVFTAPVLAGETLENLFLQSRVITDPVKDPLVGWWIEYFVWYVKLRDIQFMGGILTYPAIESMLLDPTWDMTSSTLYEAAARAYSFKAANSIDWPYLCNRRCIETYFRLDGESFNAGLIGNQPSVSIGEDEGQGQGLNWMNSIVDETAVSWDTGINVDLNADTTITTAEIDQAMRMWQWQTLAGQTNLSYQDYLKQFGIQVPVGDLHRPELVRFVRQWQYPSNTVDPLTGTPTSAVSWSISERADKNRFFSEPGFLHCASVARPKVYMSKQTDAAVMMLRNTFAWQPQVMAPNPETSWQKFTSGTTATRGPLGANATNTYWADIKDLFLYGDHFTNRGANLGSAVALPTATLGKRYASDADADGLFKATANKVRQDGVINLHVLGTQVETSPQDQRYT